LASEVTDGQSRIAVRMSLFTRFESAVHNIVVLTPGSVLRSHAPGAISEPVVSITREKLED
jgi:hypothetical protein